MTAYLPSLIPDDEPAAPVTKPGPKLDYAIGEIAWTFTGRADKKTGDVRLTPTTVCAFLDLPELAQRIFVLKVLDDPDYCNLILRDAVQMSPTRNVTDLPAHRTKHDWKERDELEKSKIKPDWRDA